MSGLKLLSKNIFSNYGMYLAKMVAGLLSLPACLNAYGNEMYGLYLISFSLSASMASFDFGGSKSIFRYVVEYETDQDKDKFSTALSAGITFNIISSILIVFILLIIGINSTSLFQLSVDAKDLSFSLFILAIINAVILTISSIPINILNANNCFHERNILQFIPIASTLIIVLYLFLNKSFPLIHFAIAMVGISLLSLSLDLLLVWKNKFIRNIPIRLILNRSLFKVNNIQYNYRVFLFSIISFLSVQADKLIIASFFSVSAVAIYAIITKPYFLLKGILAISYPVVQPQLSKYNFELNRENFNSFSARIIRPTFIIFLSIIALLSIFFEEALWIWLRTTEYNSYIYWGIISMVTLCITTLYSPYYRTLFYTNNISNILNFSFFSVSINLIASVILTSILGFPGVIIGTLIQIILEYFYINYITINKLKADLKLIYTKNILYNSLGIISFSLIIYTIKSYVLNLNFAIIILMIISLFALIFITYKTLKSEKIYLFNQNKKESEAIPDKPLL